MQYIFIRQIVIHSNCLDKVAGLSDNGDVFHRGEKNKKRQA